MRSTTVIALIVLLAGGTVFAMPPENTGDIPSTPDGTPVTLPSVTEDTPMVDGRVRALARAADTIWVGGNFSQVERHDGSVVDDVANVAVFDASTGRYLDIAPALGDEGSEVWDMDVYGDDVVIAGKFPGPGTEENNLVVVDGATGAIIRWYDAPVVRSALAVPELSRIYGGGRSLSAFDFESGERLWSHAKTTVDRSLRSYGVGPGYRDLELDADGSTIWAACGCDAVVAPDGTSNPAKAMVKLDTAGNHDTSWVTGAEPEAFGISVTDQEGSLYLAAGGNDFLAQYPKVNNGHRGWSRDTSGSAQVVEAMNGRLVIGGHFWEVADQATDDCGHRSSDNDATLDPEDQCQTRKGLASYSFDGSLDLDWDPVLSGRYNLTWALLPDSAGILHVGGEFLTVDGAEQAYYAKLSNP